MIGVDRIVLFLELRIRIRARRDRSRARHGEMIFQLRCVFGTGPGVGAAGSG